MDPRLESRERCLDIPQETPDDVLQQPHSLLLHQMAYHVAQHRPHRIESLVRVTYVFQSTVIKQDFLHDEDGDSLAQLTPGFHHAQAERNDLSREKEVDDVGRVIFDKSTDDAE